MDRGTTNDIQGQIPQVVRSLDELAREGARRLIAEALELEVEELCWLLNSSTGFRYQLGADLIDHLGLPDMGPRVAG